MVYCNDCGKERGWPTDALLRSAGPCEICGNKAACSDIPSKQLPKPKPKVKFTFAPIDAKDNYIIGIEGPNGMSLRPKSEHNTKLIYEASRSYLKRLQELQDSILSEFGFQFKDESDLGPEDIFCIQNCPCNRDKSGKNPCELVGSDLRDLYYT